MSYDPTLGDTREDYDLAIALGYDWVARAHAGEDVPMSERVLEQHPFTIDGDSVVIREGSTTADGRTRFNRRGDRVIRRVRRQPLPDGY